MRAIYIITTGGTIEKVYSEQSGEVVNKSNKIEEYLGVLRLPDCHIEVIPVMNKDSLQMTSEDRALLASEITRLLPKERPIIITHGTDTMVQTGLYLKREFRKLKIPIILTGAMTPLGFERSDGLQNLTESLFAGHVLNPGVFIVMHGRVFPVDAVRKDKQLATFVVTDKTEEAGKI